jgi:dephospho-CoA kinase
MSTTKRIIGLSGTNGAGKDTVAMVLAKQYNFMFISVSDVLRVELRKRGLDTSRENMRDLSAEWRRAHGLGVLIDQGLQQFATQQNQYDGVVLSSLRNPAEADAIHAAGGTVVWIDADPKVRYERIAAAQRGRTDDAGKTYEQFLAEEQAEMQHSGDEATLSMSAVKERCDIQFLNNTNDIQQLATDIERTLELSK